MKDEEIILKLVEENREGLQRLADEEPAAERRSRLKRLKRRVEDLFIREEKIGEIEA